MGTEIFYGGFGTGKTGEMFVQIKKAAEKRQKCILFVPEQFSFDTERAVYFSVGAENIRYVKVTGFSKLSREILNQYNAANPCADNAVKLITMWKIIDNSKRDLVCYKDCINSAGLCFSMLKTISAFKNAGISPEDCKKKLTAENVLDEDLADKAGDFLTIYTNYDRLLAESSFDDKLDDVSKAAVLAREHEYFKGCKLFFDNFDSFSEVQKKMLSVALSQCDKSVFCLSCNSPKSRKREFLCVAKTANDIKAIDPNTTEREFSEVYRSKKRAENPVKIFSAKTPYDEAELIAAEIHRSVREEGSRYRDFLILTSDSEYEEIISDRLRCSEIPIFCDFPHQMTEKPIVSFVLLILKALSLETEDILNLAECGFLRVRDFDQQGSKGEPRRIFSSEAYRLRCAAESYDIDTEDWKKGFEKDSRKPLAALENLRKGIVEPLEELKKRLENAADGAKLSEIFMNYLLNEQNLQSAFIAASKADAGGEVQGIEIDEESAKEIGRIWDLLTEAFTSMAYCLEGKKIETEDYRLLLEEILSGINLANPPQVLDCVTLGDIERTRKSSPKTVIMAGFNEGKIPRSSHLESIFTENELEALNNAELPVYDSKLNRNSKEHYFAQRALNLYEKNLIITYSHQGADGGEQAPSNILSTGEFKNLPVIPKEKLPAEYFINTVYDLRSALSSSCGKNNASEKYKEILSAFNDSEYGKKAEDALILLKAGRRFSLSEDIAQKLFGGKIYSPTSLETAFNCPFMYFGKYGLGLRDNDSYDITAPNNRGTAIHNMMCSVLTKTPDLAEKNDEELEQLARKAVEEEAERTVAANPTFPERTKEIFEGMLPQITCILKQMSFELKQGDFKPAENEKRISYEIKENGKSIIIQGTTDRVDVMTDGGKEYVRIFDYKTGNTIKKFSLDNVEQGADLQMLLYLFAECGSSSSDDCSGNNNKKRIPAGIGYFNAGAARIFSAAGNSQISQSDLYKEWYNNHIISGAIFDGNDKLKNQADKYNEEVKEKTGGKRTTNKFYNTEYLSSDKFEELRQHIEKDIILKKVNSLLKGDIAAVPLEKSGNLPCSFCELSCICANKNGNTVRPCGESDEMNQFRHTDDAKDIILNPNKKADKSANVIKGEKSK